MGTAGACPAAGQMCTQAGRFGFFVPGLSAAARLGVYRREGPLCPCACRRCLTRAPSPHPQVSLGQCFLQSDSQAPRRLLWTEQRMAQVLHVPAPFPGQGSEVGGEGTARPWRTQWTGQSCWEEAVA